MTYNERVLALAAKMAHASYHDTLYSLGLDPEGWENEKNHWIDMHRIQAEISVSEMAEIVRFVLEFNHTQDYIKNWLESLGLIPDSEQPEIIPVQAGDRRYGQTPHDPDNPAPDITKVCPACGEDKLFWVQPMPITEQTHRCDSCGWEKTYDCSNSTTTDGGQEGEVRYQSYNLDNPPPPLCEHQYKNFIYACEHDIGAKCIHCGHKIINGDADKLNAQEGGQDGNN